MVDDLCADRRGDHKARISRATRTCFACVALLCISRHSERPTKAAGEAGGGLRAQPPEAAKGQSPSASAPCKKLYSYTLLRPMLAQGDEDHCCC